MLEKTLQKKVDQSSTNILDGVKMIWKQRLGEVYGINTWFAKLRNVQGLFLYTFLGRRLDIKNYQIEY